MTEETKQQLRLWANTFHSPDFIADDPVRFPHRFHRKQDVEISGMLTAILSFGNRKQILAKAEELHMLMGGSPYDYVVSGVWKEHFPPSRKSFYRMLDYTDIRSVFALLHDAYRCCPDLEEVLLAYSGSPMERLCTFMGVSASSPQKKLNMFLRWMIRKHSSVDLGIWTHFHSRDLIIPLDTHVCHMAYKLGLTSSVTYSLKNAKTITHALAEVFPDDPCLGDFALFGSGVNKL